MNYICFILSVLEAVRDGDHRYESEVAVFAISYEQACKTYKRDTFGFQPEVSFIKDAFLTTHAGFRKEAMERGCASYIDENISEAPELVTKLVDSQGTPVRVGDILDCQYGYAVEVVHEPEGEEYGKLVAEKGHPCENIPFSLREMESYTVRKEKK